MTERHRILLSCSQWELDELKAIGMKLPRRLKPKEVEVMPAREKQALFARVYHRHWRAANAIKCAIYAEAKRKKLEKRIAA